MAIEKEQDLRKLSRQVRALVRKGSFSITQHALEDHPERQIFAEDILEALKIGEIASTEPKEENGKVLYRGEQRYRWFGEDQNDRVLRLIIVIKRNVVVVSAAVATDGQTERYRKGSE